MFFIVFKRKREEREREVGGVRKAARGLPGIAIVKGVGPTRLILTERKMDANFGRMRGRLD